MACLEVYNSPGGSLDGLPGGSLVFTREVLYTYMVFLCRFLKLRNTADGLGNLGYGSGLSVQPLA